MLRSLSMTVPHTSARPARQDAWIQGNVGATSGNHEACPYEVEPYALGFSGRINGNRMTSRMERELVSSIARRSMPMPSPPVGGKP